MGKLPESGVRPLLKRDSSIFPLQDGMTYLTGWGDVRTILPAKTPKSVVACSSQGVWYRRRDGREYFDMKPAGKASPYDIRQRQIGVTE
jgi:hypothetical protein